ncbi:uncharacterized protein LOC129194997 [Dunckerocampus dactyliophorus]|uniref:uncharacterized protein LOC129194997 n=1 Tax=Dunckerocampus dactyliophorus TaxID=161453 RepID=UPI00240700D3|nr:uncharacterized protein LOC129194997 [Dunckerocampus dactyliophorus]
MEPFFYFGMMSLLSVLVSCDPVPDGVVHMECHERYFMIAVDRSFAGDEARFEAVGKPCMILKQGNTKDRTGVYAITKSYAASCGYSIAVVPSSSCIELRASYFSCHTANQDDQVFTFSFNLLARCDGAEVVYALNKTCLPLLQWSPREVTCEVNYMEVSVRSEITCAAGTRKDDWNTLTTAHASATSDWQVMFQNDVEQIAPMSLSDARERGYVFELTDGRLVFRAPYGQPHAFISMVNGIPVEVVHATLFSRQSWFVIMVDLLTTCSIHEGTFEDGHVVFETPEALYPGPDATRLFVGLNSELLEPSVFTDREDIVIKNNTVQIRIPFNMDGGHRKSVASGDLYEFFTFHLHMEQLFDDEEETRLRLHRMLVTPLLLHPLFTQNQTVVEEHMFTVYLGDIPEDVELLSFQLNGHEILWPLANTSSYTIVNVVQPNHQHGYMLKVPFDDPAVSQEFCAFHSVKYSLGINYTLRVLPENELCYHSVSVSALTDVSPPVLDAACSETGITFRVDHRPLDFLWFFSVGSEELTSELAAQRGYRMTNDSHALQVVVPLFTQGFQYEGITLKGFLGTFEILVKERQTSAVQRSITKTCPFTSSEVIACSMDGRMTVLADLSLITPSGATPSSSNLLDVFCCPVEADSTRALFSFPLNSCSSKVKLYNGEVIYENEIFYYSKHASERVVVQCTYPLDGLHRLFSMHRFESDSPGSGRIIHSSQPTAAPLRATTVLQTRAPAPMRTSGDANAKLLASYGNVRYFRVLKSRKPHPDRRKGLFFQAVKRDFRHRG